MSAAWALLVIDMQRDFCAPGGYAGQAGMDIARLRAPIPCIQQLLAAARARGLAIVHTREGHRPDLSDCSPAKMARSLDAGAAIGSMGPMGRLLVRGEYGHDIIDELAPLPGEPVVDKPGYGAFYQTDLELMLRNAGVQRLVLTGITTEVCVHSTLREAVDRGFSCVTVADACAASDPAIHEAALAMTRGEGSILGEVWDTERVLAAWGARARAAG
ncbi:MAG: cysteine hydrolase [Gammaproteobacteria bacterium]